MNMIGNENIGWKATGRLVDGGNPSINVIAAE